MEKVGVGSVIVLVVFLAIVYGLFVNWPVTVVAIVACVIGAAVLTGQYK